MINVRTVNGDKQTAAIRVLTTTGSKDVGAVRMLTTQGDRTLFQVGSGGAFGVDATPYVEGFAARNGPINVTTDIATATVVGGRAPFKYEWAPTQATPSWRINNPSGPQSSFSISVNPGGTLYGTFSVKVTDARGFTATEQVQASATNYGSPTGGNQSID